MNVPSSSPTSLDAGQSGSFLFARSTLALLLVMSLCCVFFGIGGYRVLTMHEVHVTSVARQMIETGDYIVPYEGGRPRLEKPPLAYWIAVGSAQLFGELNAFTTRVPSGIFALLLAGFMGYWATQWYGRKVGYFTAFVQITCYYSMLWARKTEIDMCLTLVNVLALYLIATQPRNQSWKQGFPRGVLIFALFGISTLAKFYYGPALILAITGIYWLIEKRLKDLIHALNPIGWVLWIAPFGLWAWAITQRLPNAWEVWKYETVGRVTGEVGYTPFWFYLPETIWVTLPWTPLWIVSLKESWTRAWKERDSQERFLWVWFVVPFVIISIQPDKHTNYMMTFLPVLSMLAGRRLATILTPERWLSFRWTLRQAQTITVLNLIGGIAVAFVLLTAWPCTYVTATLCAMILAVGMNSATWLLYRNRQPQATLVLAGCFTVFAMVFFGGIQPARDSRKLQTTFCEEVYQKYPEEPIVGYQISLSSTYYLGPHVWLYRDRLASETDLVSRMKNREHILIVSPEKVLDDLRKYGTLSPVMNLDETQRAKWDGRYPILGCWKLTPHAEIVADVPPANRQ